MFKALIYRLTFVFVLNKATIVAYLVGTLLNKYNFNLK